MDPKRPISPNKTNLITDSSFYVYHDVFELMKETGHGSRTVEVMKCYKISLLGILNGDYVRL